MVRNDHPLFFVLLSTAGLYAEGSSDGSQHGYRYSQNLAPDVLVFCFHKLLFFSPQITQISTDYLFNSIRMVVEKSVLICVICGEFKITQSSPHRLLPLPFHRFRS